MAFEVRCPDCRTKLRLSEAPPPGEEIECPKCSVVFAVPDRETAEDRPRKKKAKAAVASPAKTEAKPSGDKPKGNDAAPPKKRKSKKKKSNPAVLFGSIGGGVLVLLLMVGYMVHLQTRQPAAISMMTFLPDDANTAGGINLEQFRNYQVIYKDIDALQIVWPDRSQGTLSKAFESDFIDLVEYLVWGDRHGGGADPADTVVIRGKKDFNQAALAKLGGREETVNGVKVYTAILNDIPGRTSAQEVKVFSPNSRVIVVTNSRISAANLQKMVRGNTGDDGFVARMGPLGKQTCKGTVWRFEFFDRSKPVEVSGKTGVYTSLLGLNAPGGEYDPGRIQGYGYRGSLGSRSIRFEADLWCLNPEQAAKAAENYNKSELSKGDEGQTPGWWLGFAQHIFSEKIISLQILSNLRFTASGELFIVRTEGDLKKLQDRIRSWGGQVHPKPR